MLDNFERLTTKLFLTTIFHLQLKFNQKLSINIILKMPKFNLHHILSTTLNISRKTPNSKKSNKNTKITKLKLTAVLPPVQYDEGKRSGKFMHGFLAVCQFFVP